MKCSRAEESALAVQWGCTIVTVLTVSLVIDGEVHNEGHIQGEHYHYQYPHQHLVVWVH